MAIPTNFNGTFKRVKQEGMDDFLKAQGAPWAGRKALLAEKPSCTLTADGNSFRVVLKSFAASDTTFYIDADPVECKTKNTTFMDTATVVDGKVVVTRVNDDGKLVIERFLNEDGSKLTAVSTYTFNKDGKSVSMTHYFDRK